MLVLTILSIFILIIIVIIFLEYRNEKKYQEKRRQQRQRPNDLKGTTPPEEPKKVTPKPTPAPRKTTPKPELKIEPKPEPKIEVKETKKLPEANYPQFTHVRLVEMGLSDEEAKEFVAELIPEIETKTLLLKEAMDIPDFNEMERITHGIKGAATNIGTGGVADLLVDYNTYLKTAADSDIARAYLEQLVHYTNELKAQYALIS